jgi:nucleoside-diphosphate-sugar epimerase
MKILLTGSTGFIGKKILEYFIGNNFLIKTIGRNNSNDIYYNFNSIVENLSSFEVVIHSAGKAHVLNTTIANSEKTFDFNTRGTEFLLKSLKASNIPKYFILISSVSVYGLEEGEKINEDFPLKAKDSYGISKIEEERLVINWCILNNVKLTILRLPLVIGENPPGNLGNFINAIKKGFYFNIDDGSAKKSVIHIDDIPKFINLSYKIGGIYNITDGYDPSFLEISNHFANLYNTNKIYSLPFFVIKPISILGDYLGNNFPINSNKLNKMTRTLTFDDTKARLTFDWNPTPIIQKT